MNSKRGEPRITPRGKRPISDLLKLVGTAVLIVVTVMLIAIGSAKYNISSAGTERLFAALICLSVGAMGLYGVGKHWNYVSQLPDSVGNRKIKRQQKMFLIVGFLLLGCAAWNLWRFASLK